MPQARAEPIHAGRIAIPLDLIAQIGKRVVRAGLHLRDLTGGTTALDEHRLQMEPLRASTLNAATHLVMSPAGETILHIPAHGSERAATNLSVRKTALKSAMRLGTTRNRALLRGRLLGRHASHGLWQHHFRHTWQ
jgi:hypothetical protein